MSKRCLPNLEKAIVSDSTGEQYAALVAEAEAAVAGVADPELRRVAFEKILDTLLSEASKGSKKKSAARTSSSKKSPGRKKVAKPAKKTASKRGPKARVVELIDESFFSKQRTIADVKAELANRGYHIPLTSLSGPLQSLTQERKLRRQKSKKGGESAKGTYAYSNW